MRKTTRMHLGLLVAICAAAACADFGSTLRKVTYPPDFNYVPREQMQSAMWQLAGEVRDLDRTLRDQAVVEPGRQSRVLAILERMNGTASRLGGPGEASNHPHLDRNLPRLRNDIVAARTAASASPPSYALAGAVSGACIYCHEARVPGPRIEN